MIPSSRALWMVGVWVALSAAAAVWPPLRLPWLGVGLLVALAMGADAVWAVREKPLRLERALHQALAVGAVAKVRLKVVSRSTRRLRVQVTDHSPRAFVVQGLPRQVSVRAGEELELEYLITPGERGDHFFEEAEARVLSPWGLWWKTVRGGGPLKTQVYPNFRAVQDFKLLVAENRVAQLGIRLMPRRGLGTEFHGLREFRDGDTLRTVDWKASSRRGKLISKEYQEDQGQQIVFVLDCGRRMRGQDGPASHFDHALDALLLLSYVALRQGDAVGVWGLGGPNAVLPPRKGVDKLPSLLNRLYSLQPSLEFVDLSAGLRSVLADLRRRSLVVVMTNLGDEQDDGFLPVMDKLLQRHLVLLANLRDPLFAQVLKKPVEDFEDALRTASVHQYLASRSERDARLRATGMLSLETEPWKLAPALVSKYWELKAGGRL